MKMEAGQEIEEKPYWTDTGPSEGFYCC
jgi:hypothetical protein